MLMKYSNLTSLFPKRESITKSEIDVFLEKSESLPEIESTKHSYVLRNCNYTGYFMQELFIKTARDTILNGHRDDQDKLNIFWSIFGDIFFFSAMFFPMKIALIFLSIPYQEIPF